EDTSAARTVAHGADGHEARTRARAPEPRSAEVAMKPPARARGEWKGSQCGQPNPQPESAGMDTTDHRPKPHVVDIDELTVDNTNYRTTHWTGSHLQLTLMSIPPGGDIGLEVHPDNDQFLRLEQGRGRCQMGATRDALTFDEQVGDGWAIFV